MFKIVDDGNEVNSEITFETLDALARKGARRMLQQALEAEAQSFIDRHKSLKLESRAAVVRNGHSPSREITIGSGSIKVKAPRVRDNRPKSKGRVRFSSKILPPYMRRSPEVSEVLPVLYLRGLSTGDFKDALKCLLGDKASGLSSSNIARLTDDWEKDYKAFKKRRLSQEEYAYVWVDGIHFNVRLEDDRVYGEFLITAKSLNYFGGSVSAKDSEI